MAGIIDPGVVMLAPEEGHCREFFTLPHHVARSRLSLALRSGYFRMGAVQPYLQSGQLHLVPGAPHFSFPVYVLHSVNADVDTLKAALLVLREIARAEVK